MFRSKSLLVFACFALGFGFTQSASSQWWPSTGTDTDNEWGGGGWGSFVEIYIDQAPLQGLTAPVPGCKGNPNNCAQIPIFGPGLPASHLPVSAPKLNGLSLGLVGSDLNPPNCANPNMPPFTATMTGNADTTPPTLAVCIIRNDAGFRLPKTAAYCAVDVTVNNVAVSDDSGNCVYERTLTNNDWLGTSGAPVFGPSVVDLFPSVPVGLDPNSFPPLNPKDVPQCDPNPKTPDTPLSGDCTINIGLPTGVICPQKGQPSCRSNLLPSTAVFAQGQVLVAKEQQNTVALRYCVSDVDGGAGTIACKGGDKQVETAEAVVIVECDGNYSVSADTFNTTGNNTHKWTYLSTCFPELDSPDIETSDTIQFETVVNGIVTKSGVRPANACQLGGENPPSELTCFVFENELAEGCVSEDDVGPGEPLGQSQACLTADDGDSTTGCIDELRGLAVVQVEGNNVPLIATDGNDGNGFSCRL